MRRYLIVLGLAVMALAAAAVSPRAEESAAATQLLPNLRARPAFDLRIEQTLDGRKLLRFSVTSYNVGDGPVELVGGTVDTGTSKQQVDQRIYNSDGSSTLVNAGSFDWHAAHGHIHFNDYALYTLQPVNAPGGSARTGSKTTFCIIDTTRIKGVPRASKRPTYTSCGQLQGMSVGWGDTYTSSLPGQEIDITGLPDGEYELTVDADFRDNIVELDEGDNSATVRLVLSGNSVSVPGGRGRR